MFGIELAMYSVGVEIRFFFTLSAKTAMLSE